MTETKKAAAPTGGEEAVDSKRKAYRKKRESALQELDAKIDELKKKSLEMTAGTREDLDAGMQAISEKRKRFVASLGSLREASGDAWGDVKKGVDNSWDELEDAFGDLRKGFSSAIGRFTDSRKS